MRGLTLFGHPTKRVTANMEQLTLGASHPARGGVPPKEGHGKWHDTSCWGVLWHQGEPDRGLAKPGQKKEAEDSPLRWVGTCLPADQNGGLICGNRGKETEAQRSEAAESS